MNDKHELATIDQAEALPAIADTTLVAIAEQLEKRVEAMTKIKRMALRLTNRHDWVDENGKPYLQASGAEKVARLFGISWRVSEPIIENLEGGHWLVTYTGEFSLGGATIEAVGTRSSKDGFFRQYRWEGEGDKRRKIELPASEIDRGDVKKSAYTNLLANGITRLLGIRNLTYEDLQECAGVRKEDITSVTFKKGGSQVAKPAPAPKPKAEAEAGDNGGGATEAQSGAIHAILTKLGITDALAKAQKVQGALGLPSAPTSMSKLTKQQASAAIQALQAELGAGGEA